MISLYFVGVALLVVALALALNAAMNDTSLWSAGLFFVAAVIAVLVALLR